jgi:triacylglycerol lipase
VKRPVVLVPGWADRPRSLRHIRAHLLRSGYSTDSLHVLDFKRRFGSNTEHARELSNVLLSLPGDRDHDVDIVAHSMGGLAVRHLFSAHPRSARRIHRVICLGSPHAGTRTAWLGWGIGAREMRPGSEFLSKLPRGVPEGSDFVNIRAPLDLRILPGSSTELAGARNFQVPCLGHRDLLRRGAVLRRIVELLAEP